MVREEKKTLNIVTALISLILVWAAMIIAYIFFLYPLNLGDEIINFMLINLAICTLCVFVNIIHIAISDKHNIIDKLLVCVVYTVLTIGMVLSNKYSKTYLIGEILTATPYWALSVAATTYFFAVGFCLHALITIFSCGIFAALFPLLSTLLSAAFSAAVYFAVGWITTNGWFMEKFQFTAEGISDLYLNGALTVALTLFGAATLIYFIVDFIIDLRS